MTQDHGIQINADWFLPAIVADGGVFQSFQAVEQHLLQKLQFIHALHHAMSPGKTERLDRISALVARIRKFNETLNFRLGMLSPDRPGAWFRPNMNHKTAPFGVSILSEPVLAAYDPEKLADVREVLRQSYLEGTIRAIPFKVYAPCLWLTLLQMNQEWHHIDRLAAPFDHVRLSQLPQTLPQELASAALRAFLVKVNEAFAEARLGLETSYQRLWEACEGFWREQQRETSKGQGHGQGSRVERDGAASPKRSRRSGARAAQARGLATQDVRALHYMNFDQIPDRQSLKKRYHDLALCYHPDVQGGSEEKFLRLTQSYRYLATRLDDIAGP